MRNLVAHWNPERNTGLGSPLDFQSLDGRADKEAQEKQKVREEEIQEMETKKAKLFADYKQAVEDLIPLLVILRHDFKLESGVINKLWESFEARQQVEEKINMATDCLNHQQAEQIKLYALITDKTCKNSFQHTLKEIKKETPAQLNEESKQQKDIVDDKITRCVLKRDCNGYAYLDKIFAEIIEKVSLSIGN